MQGLISGTQGQAGGVRNRIEPPQAPSASSGSERSRGWVQRPASEQRQRAEPPRRRGRQPSGNTQRQRASRAVAAQSRGCSLHRQPAIRCKNRVATHRIKKLGLYHVSRRVDARPASLPERERLLVLLRPGPLPTPDAGKALIHTQVLASASLESQSRVG